MVGSGTRNARAISAVVRPPSSRRVSATWTPVPRAGWQQVKIRRRRSSRTGALLGRLVPGVEQGGLGVPVLPGGLPAEPVDGPVAGGGDDPAGRARGQAGRRPPLHGRGERVLDGLLGDVDVAEDPDQDGDRPAVLLAEDPLDLGGGTGRHARAQSPGSPWNGRTSIGRVVARASRRPQSRAASRSGARTMVNPPMCSLPSANGPVGDEHLAVGDPHHGGRARRVQPAGEHPRPGLAQLAR